MAPRKGTHVAELTVKDIVDVLEVRAALDGLATELAARHIQQEHLRQLENIHKQYVTALQKENLSTAIKKDVEFHEVIYNASENAKLMSVAGNLREQIYRFRVLYMKDFSNAADVLEEHRNILKALGAQDQEQAGFLAKEHIIHQQQVILQQMGEK